MSRQEAIDTAGSADEFASEDRLECVAREFDAIARRFDKCPIAAAANVDLFDGEARSVNAERTRLGLWYG